MNPNACSIQVILLEPTSTMPSANAQWCYGKILENSIEPGESAGTLEVWKHPIDARPMAFASITGIVWEDNGNLEDTLEHIAQDMIAHLGTACPGFLAILHTPGTSEIQLMAFSAQGKDLGIYPVELATETDPSFPKGMPAYAGLALDTTLQLPRSPQLARLFAHLRQTDLENTLPPSASLKTPGPRF